MASGTIKSMIVTRSLTKTTQNNGAWQTEASKANGYMPIGFKVITTPSDVTEVGGWFVLGSDNNYYLMAKTSTGAAISSKSLTLGITYVRT